LLVSLCGVLLLRPSGSGFWAYVGTSFGDEAASEKLVDSYCTCSQVAMAFEL